MLKHLLFLILVVASAGAQAEVFMCKKPNGDTEFSDTPCKAGSSSEVLPDRDPLTQQQKDEAQQRLQQQKREANDLGAQRAATQAQAQRRETEVAAPAAPVPDDAIDEEAIANCAADGRRNTNCARRLDNAGPYIRPAPRPVPR